MQGIVPEGEWDAFIQTLRKPLPTTFRINGRGRFAADLRDRLQQDFFSQFNENMEVGAPCCRPRTFEAQCGPEKDVYMPSLIAVMCKQFVIAC